MQFPAWLFLSLFVFTYLLSCALKLNDDDDDDDDDDMPVLLKLLMSCFSLYTVQHGDSIFVGCIDQV